MKNITECKLLAIGASMTALGLAMAKPRDVLIIERKATPAPEFTGAFGGNDEGEPAIHTDAGISLQRELETRGILHDGRYNLPVLGSIYCKLLNEHSLRHLFWTDVLDIKRRSGGYIITIFNASGIQYVEAARIVDTSVEPLQAPSGRPRRWTKKELRALTHGAGCPASGFRPFEVDDDVIWQSGCFESENIFGIRLPPDTGWPEARIRLLTAWRERPACLADARLAALATDFHYICPTGPFDVEKDWIHLPAAAYPDPLTALEAGLEEMK